VSQVVVTDDVLRDKRQKSALQEQQISCENGLDKWRMRSLHNKKHPLMTVVGIALSPILAAWAFLMLCVGYALGLAAFIFVGMRRILAFVGPK